MRLGVLQQLRGEPAAGMWLTLMGSVQSCEVRRDWWHVSDGLVLLRISWCQAVKPGCCMMDGTPTCLQANGRTAGG